MRNAILSGLTVALGILTSPVLGQDSRTSTPPVRAARLGLPVGVSDTSPPNQTITPAGLLVPDPDFTQVPTPVPTPPGGISAPLVPVVPANPMATQLPAPKPIPAPGTNPIPGAPSVTEVRMPDGTPTPTATIDPGVPTIVPGYQAIQPVPTVVPTAPPYGDCPPNCPEQQLGNDCAIGRPAVDRVNSCNRWFVSAEYLMWWTRSMQVPTLLTTSAPGDFGILGRPTTTSLYGGDQGNTFHGGARFGLGHWFCDDPKWGVDAHIFFLGESISAFSANSSEYPVLARPFYNANTPVGPFSELIAYPGLATGSALIKTSTSLWGADANVRRVLFGNPTGSGFELDAIVGYRFMELDEGLSIEESFTRVPGSPMTVGTPAISGTVTDQFRTHDVFNGGQIGLSSSYTRGPWSIEGRATIAFGDLEQSAYINGAQNLTFANGVTTKTVGGLLALPGANIGVFDRHQFAVLPEVTLNVGYQLTSHTRLFIGYDFLFLGNALRPGGAVDTTLDAARIPNFPVTGGATTPLPGAPRPGPYFNTSDFFAQGINFGLQFRW